MARKSDNAIPAQRKQLELHGLYTDPNRFSGAAPEASLLVADNVNINKDNVIEVRRGLRKIYGNTVSVSTSKIKQMFQYADTLLVHHNDKLSYDANNEGGFVQYSGTFVEPTDGQIRGVEANRNLYVNTSTGIRVIDTVNGTPRAAGVEKGLGGVAVVGDTDSGFLANGESRQYRVVWTYTDANDNLVQGDVSERIVVTNGSGNPQHVELSITIPDSITTANTIQIYRTKSTTDNTSLFLVGERNPTSGEITAQAVSFTDNVEDTQLGQILYTSFEEGGLTQGNQQPPIAADIVEHKGYILFGNVTNKHNFFLQMTKLVEVNDTITIGGRTYTAKAAENVANREFEVFTDGTEAEDIEATVRSLINVINKDTGNTSFYAFYNSTVDDPTGKIWLQERGIGGSGFALTSNASDCWHPELPSSGTSVASDNAALPHGLMWTKFQQPEAVPITNLLRVGSANYPILRVVALRDGVFLFKNGKDDGLHYLTIDGGNFNLRPFDLTLKLLVPESAKALADKVYCLTQRGIEVINYSGAEVISDPIEGELKRIRGFANFQTATFGVAYDSDRKYILWTVTEPTDTHATQAFVYNEKTQQWTVWRAGAISAGHVLTRDDKLYLGSADVVGGEVNVFQERKNDIGEDTRFDYAEESYEIEITAVEVGGSQLVITVADASNIAVGDTIKQGGKTAEVAAIDGNNIELDQQQQWEIDDPEYPETEVYKPIEATIQFIPFHLGSSALVKVFDEFTYLFRETKVDRLSAFFSTNEMRTGEFIETTVAPTSFEGDWGEFLWGTGEWGGGPGGGQQKIRAIIPRKARRGNWLNVKISYKQAFAFFQFEGGWIQWYPVSERSK